MKPDELPPAAQVSFAARDGRTLTGSLTLSGQPRAAVVINGATGFRREFYLKLAGYGAQRGYHVLTYDYRGIGASAQHPLAHDPARMSDWGRLDMPAALQFMAQQFPQLQRITVGHSVGGQLLGCLDNAQLAIAHVMLASSTGYWGRQRRPFRYQALAFWKLYGPLLLRRLGYVPRSVLWRGESLPAQVFLQWRRWCLSPALLGPALDPDLPAAGFAAIRGPLLAWGFSDDPIATPAAIDALLASYPNASIERRLTSPREAGVRHIGHHGFFAPEHQDRLWAGLFDWIDLRLRSRIA